MITIISKGAAEPIGPTCTNNGYNLCVVSSESVQQLCVRVFNGWSDLEPAYTIPMASSKITIGDRTYKAWHIFIAVDSAELLYQFEADGRNIADPWGREFTSNVAWDASGNLIQPKTIARADKFNWEGDKRPNIPMADTEVYEVNVSAYTSEGFLGIARKADYISRVATTVELMPPYQGDPDDVMTYDPATGERNKGSWCYNTWAYFAPDGRLASKWGRQVVEFKQMVKELHRKGLEVVVDVVYNHTREGGKTGPVINLKALAANEYYFLEPDGTYPDRHTGCGNTVNPFSPLAEELILQSLRYWYNELHVDGFRFDLFAVLALNPKLVERIINDPELKGCKLFPEPWAIHLYMLGACGHGTAEWNGKFRDVVRSWMKGDFGRADEFKTKIAGSPDSFQPADNHWSVNFVTCHDGFTLKDLVSFNHKRNLRNGENNNDGESHNASWNCGPNDNWDGYLDLDAEGEDGDKARSFDPEERLRVLGLRKQQQRNFLVILFMSQGVPLLLYGDECDRGAEGDNNTYCRPDLNKMPREGHGADLLAFTRFVVSLRRKHHINDCRIVLHGVSPKMPDTSGGSRFLAQELIPRTKVTGEHLYWASNAHDADLDVILPNLPAGKRWYEVINTTTAETPTDGGKPVNATISVAARSNLVLVAR